jgi:hypothetical protein
VKDGVEIIATAFKNRISTYRIKPKKIHINLKGFMSEIKIKVIDLVLEHLKTFTAIKVQFEVFGSYVITEKELKDIKSFNTKYKIVTNATDLEELVNSFMEIMDQKMQDFQERDSGWALESILFLEVNINKYNPLRASSYIKLPTNIAKRKAILNIKKQ